MDKWLLQLEQMTVQLVKRLEETDEEDLVKFVREREFIIAEMKKCKATDEQRERWRPVIFRLLQYDRMIVDRMRKSRDESSAKKIMIGKARLQRNIYESSYSPESVFFDRKK